VETARSIHTAGLERIVAGVRRARVLNEPERPEQRPDQRRSVTYRREDDGSVVVIARLPADEHALLAKAIDAVLDPAGDRSIEQRRAAALIDGAARSLAAGGSTTSTADRYPVVVHHDAGVLTDPGDETGECHLDHGGAITVATARRLCCDGSIVRLYEDHHGRSVSISHKTRTVPGALRRALHARDRHCQFPGCTHRAWLDAHHRHHWVDGGATELDNLILFCAGTTIERCTSEVGRSPALSMVPGPSPARPVGASTPRSPVRIALTPASPTSDPTPSHHVGTTGRTSATSFPCSPTHQIRCGTELVLYRNLRASGMPCLSGVAVQEIGERAEPSPCSYADRASDRAQRG
jgi:hypothetical protein